MDDNYESLRDWYLARLRRQAIDRTMGERLTPMSLVRADAEVVAQIIAEKTGASAGSSTTQQPELNWAPSPDLQRGIKTWLLVSLMVPSIFLIASIALWAALDGSPLLICAVLASGLLVSYACILSGFHLLTRGIIGQLNLLSNEMESALPAEVAKRFVRAPNLLTKMLCYTNQLSRLYKEAQQRERAIVDYSTQLVCSLDRDGKIRATNPAVERLLGYGSSQLLGARLAQFSLEDDLPITLRALDTARSGKPVADMTIRMRTSDSKVVHVSWSIEWSEKGETYYCAGSDISERMQLEQLKKDFVAMITHDLRSPLSGIVTASQLIQSGRLDGQQTELNDRLRGIEQTGKRLLSLVSELLDVDRMEAGLLDLERSTVTLSSVFETSVASLQSLLDTKQITVEIASAPIEVNGDELRLIQVVTNLLANAIKFSPRQRTILIDSSLSGDSEVLVRVTDEGRGISAENQQKIFDRFKQVEIADSSLKGGSGLGLAICRAIIHAHGGEIGVESELEKGSTFWFKLPEAKLIDASTAISSSSLQ